MSFDFLENWNPMEEDYYNKEFNCYRSASFRNFSRVPYRRCNGLYIGRIPPQLQNHSSFAGMLSRYGTVTTCRLDRDKQSGFVNYATEVELETAFDNLKRPPLRLKVQRSYPPQQGDENQNSGYGSNEMQDYDYYDGDDYGGHHQRPPYRPDFPAGRGQALQSSLKHIEVQAFFGNRGQRRMVRNSDQHYEDEEIPDHDYQRARSPAQPYMGRGASLGDEHAMPYQQPFTPRPGRPPIFNAGRNRNFTPRPRYPYAEADEMYQQSPMPPRRERPLISDAERDQMFEPSPMPPRRERPLISDAERDQMYEQSPMPPRRGRPLLPDPERDQMYEQSSRRERPLISNAERTPHSESQISDIEADMMYEQPRPPRDSLISNDERNFHRPPPKVETPRQSVPSHVPSKLPVSEKSVDVLNQPRSADLPPPLIPNHPCLSCGNDSIFSCGQCRKPYCSEVCQKLDWEKHKDMCSNGMKLTANSQLKNSASEHLIECETSTLEKPRDPRNEQKLKIDLNGERSISRNAHEPTARHLPNQHDLKTSDDSAVFKKPADYVANNTTKTNHDFQKNDNSTVSKKPLDNVRSNALRTNQHDSKRSDNSASYRKPGNDVVNNATRSHFGTSGNKESIKASSPEPKAWKFDDLQKIKLPLNGTEKVSICSVESPCKFWVMRVCDREVMADIEKCIMQLKSKVQLAVPLKNDLCCALDNNGKLCRAMILDVKSANASLLYLVDFGGKVVISNCNLFCLPSDLTKYPALAVCCSLVDFDSKNDGTFSKYMTVGKKFKAHIKNCQNEIYEVSLIDENGINLSSMFSCKTSNLLSLQDISDEINVSAPIDDTKETTPEIPSALKLFKKGMQVKIVPITWESEMLWALIVDNDSVIENGFALDDPQSKDITLQVEEGDIGAAFSQQWSEWYRCVVLKRTKDKFLVRYIDYGNSEEVKKLHELTPQMKAGFSYLVRCEKSENLSADRFREIFDIAASGIVDVIQENYTQVFLPAAADVSVICVPWYSKKSTVKTIAPPKVSPPLSKKEDFSSSILIKFPFSVGWHFDVQVVFIKSLQEIFVQKVADQEAYAAMSKKLNESCNAGRNVPNYKAGIRDVVCCKFSDGIWYRGQVVEVLPSGYKVFFIDFGNEDVVSVDLIRPMTKEFCCPQFCFCVALQGAKDEDLPWLADKLTLDKCEVEIVDVTTKPVSVIFYQNGKLLLEKIARVCSLTVRTLPLGKAVDVTICFADDNITYVHMDSDLEELNAMSEKLKLCGEKNPSLKSFPTVGEVLCVKSSDMLWYRGSVENVSSDSVNIRYIDYGNRESVKLQDLTQLPTKYIEIPVFCIPINIENFNEVSALNFTIGVTGRSVKNVQVVKVVPKVQQKLPDSAVKISKLKMPVFEEKIPTEVVLLNIEHDTHIFQKTADLHDCVNMTNELQSSLSSEAISHVPETDEVLCAKGSDEIWYRGFVKKAFPDKYEMYFFDYGFTETVLRQHMRRLPEKFLEFPVFSIPVSTLNLVPRKEPLSINSMYTVQAIGNATGGKQRVQVLNGCTVGLLKKQALPPKVQTDVVFYFVENDVHYFQLVSDSLLVNEMSLKLNTSECQKSLLCTPIVGELVNAKCSEDQMWYRGCIEEVLPSETFRVLFIDYGNREVVEKKNLCFLPDGFSSYPIFGIPATIPGHDKLKDPVIFGTIYNVMSEGTPGDKNVHRIRIIPKVQELEKKMSNVSLKETIEDKLVSKKITYDECEYVDFPTGTQNVIVYSASLHNAVFCAPVNENNITSLVALNAEINEFCKKLPCQTYNDSAPVAELEMVLAKFSEDGNWYRAAVLSTEQSQSMYNVVFLDFGNTETLPMSSLRKMEKRFMALKIQSHFCTLRGYVTDAANEDKVLLELKKFTDIPLEATVSISEVKAEMLFINVPRITEHLVKMKLAMAEK